MWILSKTVESSTKFYVNSWACARIGIDVSEWFLVNVKLRRLCDVSMVVNCVGYMDGVKREVNAWEKAGTAAGEL